MIFPEVKLEDWLAKYPDLEIDKDRCANCGKRNETDKPFLLKDWIGLASICECGHHGASSMIPRNNQSTELAAGLFWSVEDSSHFK